MLFLVVVLILALYLASRIYLIATGVFIYLWYEVKE